MSEAVTAVLPPMVQDLLLHAKAGGTGWFAMPTARLLVMHIEEDYENYDFDVVPRSAREILSRAAGLAGFESKGSRCFLHRASATEVRLPRPTANLSAHPATELFAERQAAPTAYLVATPTQALALALLSQQTIAWAGECLAMVARAPANLDKLTHHARESGHLAAWAALHQALAPAQAAAVSARRARRRAPR